MINIKCLSDINEISLEHVVIDYLSVQKLTHKRITCLFLYLCANQTHQVGMLILLLT